MKRSENKGIQDEVIRGKSTKSNPGTGNSEKKNAKQIIRQKSLQA